MHHQLLLAQVMDTGISTSPAFALCRLGSNFTFLGSFTGDSFLVHTLAEVWALLSLHLRHLSALALLMLPAEVHMCMLELCGPGS